MPQTPLPLAYDEPTVMWRMRRTDGRSVAAVIDTAGSGARVYWCMNGTPLGGWHFDQWHAAIEWSERLRGHYWAAGWRLADDPTEPPRTKLTA